MSAKKDINMWRLIKNANRYVKLTPSTIIPWKNASWSAKRGISITLILILASQSVPRVNNSTLKQTNASTPAISTSFGVNKIINAFVGPDIWELMSNASTTLLIMLPARCRNPCGTNQHYSAKNALLISPGSVKKLAMLALKISQIITQTKIPAHGSACLDMSGILLPIPAHLLFVLKMLLSWILILTSVSLALMVKFGIKMMKNADKEKLWEFVHQINLSMTQLFSVAKPAQQTPPTIKKQTPASLLAWRAIFTAKKSWTVSQFAPRIKFLTNKLYNVTQNAKRAKITTQKLMVASHASQEHNFLKKLTPVRKFSAQTKLFSTSRLWNVWNVKEILSTIKPPKLVPKKFVQLILFMIRSYRNAKVAQQELGIVWKLIAAKRTNVLKEASGTRKPSDVIPARHLKFITNKQTNASRCVLKEAFSIKAPIIA